VDAKQILQILLDRIDALDRDLRAARDRLQAEEIPPSIQARLGSELFDSVDDVLSKLTATRLTAENLPAGATPEEQSRIKTAWIAFDGLRVEGERQLGEVLSLLQGARMRGQMAQHAVLAEIADRLLDELSSKLQAIAWKRFTFEAEGEAFAGNTHVIRLHFPMQDIWNLPVAVHEFGHFLASQIRVPKEAVTLVNVLGSGDEVTRDKRWYYLQEFFADAVAAYAIGPAYGYSCLLVRFNPVRAWLETDQFHPPDAWRAELILQILDRMNREPDDVEAKFTGPAEVLRELWSASLVAAGRSTEMPAKVMQDLTSLADEIYGLILKPGARHLRYNTMAKARKLVLLGGAAAALPQPLALADLLNAAWRARLASGARASDVNRAFIALCGKL
jgi:hypothetical protein